MYKKSYYGLPDGWRNARINRTDEHFTPYTVEDQFDYFKVNEISKKYDLFNNSKSFESPLLISAQATSIFYSVVKFFDSLLNPADQYSKQLTRIFLDLLSLENHKMLQNKIPPLLKKYNHKSFRTMLNEKDLLNLNSNNWPGTEVFHDNIREFISFLEPCFKELDRVLSDIDSDQSEEVNFPVNDQFQPLNTTMKSPFSINPYLYFVETRSDLNQVYLDFIRFYEKPLFDLSIKSLRRNIDGFSIFHRHIANVTDPTKLHLVDPRIAPRSNFYLLELLKFYRDLPEGENIFDLIYQKITSQIQEIASNKKYIKFGISVEYTSKRRIPGIFSILEEWLDYWKLTYKKPYPIEPTMYIVLNFLPPHYCGFKHLLTPPGSNQLHTFSGSFKHD